MGATGRYIFSNRIDVSMSSVGIGALTKDCNSLEFNNCWNVRLRNLTVVSDEGYSVNFNRGGNIFVEHVDIITTGIGGVAFRGEVDNFRVEATTFYGDTKTDILIGGYEPAQQWPFKRRASGGIISDVRREDGKPVRIVLWNAEIPAIRPNSLVSLTVVPRARVLACFTFLWMKKLAERMK